VDAGPVREVFLEAFHCFQYPFRGRP
jgi:hypothetical protein